MAITRREYINPALPNNRHCLVKLSNGGQNWYLRTRSGGRYYNKSLKTNDLTEARRLATEKPPAMNTNANKTIQRALLDFQESRQQLLDLPSDSRPIAHNTFETYRSRIKALLEYFDELKKAKRYDANRSISSLSISDLNGYKNWREKKGIMITSIKTEISQINTILTWLYNENYIESRMTVKLPRIDLGKLRKPNRIMTENEKDKIQKALSRLQKEGSEQSKRNWKFYALWLRWLEDTFCRPHECLLLKFSDITCLRIKGQEAVQFRTSKDTKTGSRLVFVTSSVAIELRDFYQACKLEVNQDSSLFLLPSTNQSPSTSWLGEMWKRLLVESNIRVANRELTQYSLRHQGISTLLDQGVPATKVADLAGHSLQMQQKTYKQYQLMNDFSILRKDKNKKRDDISVEHLEQGLPFPWEKDGMTGEWFPEV